MLIGSTIRRPFSTVEYRWRDIVKRTSHEYMKYEASVDICFKLRWLLLQLKIHIPTKNKWIFRWGYRRIAGCITIASRMLFLFFTEKVLRCGTVSKVTRKILSLKKRSIKINEQICKLFNYQEKFDFRCYGCQFKIIVKKKINTMTLQSHT